VSDLVRIDLAQLLASALGAPLLCFVFFYYGLGDWGYRTGLSLETLASSTFGTSGSHWLTDVALALANIVICAVAVDFAIDTTLLGLLSSGLVDPDALGRWSLGPLALDRPVFLATAVFWIFIICMACLLGLIGVVAALMRVYTPVALLLLTVIALSTSIVAWTSGDLVLSTLDIAAVASSASGSAGLTRMGPSALQLTCGYFALAGLASVERGAAVKSRRDVVLGGASGIVLAGAWSAAAVLIIVASAVGLAGHSRELAGFGPGLVQPLSFRWAVLHALGGRVGGTILILFALAALAPGCYACRAFGHKLALSWPRLSHAAWIWVGGSIVFALVASSFATRTGLIFSIMGDVLAPVIGAMLGDRIGRRGDWSGPRGALNAAGLLAWGAGSLVALAIDLALMRHPNQAGLLPPTSLVGLLLAGLLYPVLAAMGKEPAAESPSTSTAMREESRTLTH